MISNEDLMRYKKDNYILYHATDSDYFTTFDVKKASKGDRYFNPLGLGLYCSTNKEFIRKFGKNIFLYLLPKKSKIKFITKNKWLREYGTILIQIFKRLNMSYWTDISTAEKVNLNRIGNDAPISSLNNLSVYLDEILPLDSAGENIYEIIEYVNTKRNSKYDAVWYRITDFYLKADEIVIPSENFNKDRFLKYD